MKNSNNKETINLLDLLSESDSDLSDLVLTPKKKKVKRRHRPGSGVKMKRNNSCGCSKSDMRVISLWLAAVLITFWLIALSWLAAILYGEIKKMDISIKSVIAGSEGVPDALQKCHSLSRDLQNNQTIIFSHLSDLQLQIKNFTTQLGGVQRDLHKVHEWFQAAPELINVPKDLNALLSSVASFGSQIQDLSVTVNTLKETNTRVQAAQTAMQQNITSIKHTVQELSNITQKPQMLMTNETKIKTDELNAAILQLAHDLTHVNETLTRVEQWITEDQENYYKKFGALQDTVQNVSMKVISLQGECAKVPEQKTISLSVQKLNDQMQDVHATDTKLTEKLRQLEKLYNTLRNSTNVILSGMPGIDNPHQNNRVNGMAESLSADTTTERHHDVSEDTVKKSTGKPKLLSISRK